MEEDMCKKNILFKRLASIVGIFMLVIVIIIDRVLLSANLLAIHILYIFSYILIGYDIVIEGIKNIFKNKVFDENFLMTVATIGSIILGEYLEATMVILLYKLGEYLQDLAVDKSTQKIKDAIDIRQDFANLKVNDKVKVVKSETLKIGDIIVVKNGEKVPVDGVVFKGTTTIDNSLITGESIPVTVKENDKILSGSINASDVIEIKVEKEYKDSTVSKIVDFIEKATVNKSNTEKFITRFARIYTPVVIAIALLITIFTPILFEISIKDAIFRGLIFLVISCPCALVISIPLGFFIGIGECSKKGIVVKGSNYLDLLSTLDIMAFDKTGTLTKGNFKISKVESKDKNMSKDEIIDTISYAEFYSNHYIAKSILKEYDKKINEADIKDYKEVAGRGIRATIKSKKVLVGTKSFIEENNIEINESIDEDVGTIVHLAMDNEYKGYIVLLDELKENSSYTIKALEKYKIDTLMLTGDKENVAKFIAEELGVKKYFAGLLPEDKAKYIQKLKNEAKKVAFVGDGINDSPVIAASDVGISMSKGADISVEVANVVVMNDDPKSIIDSIKISKKTKGIIKQNITFALLVKAVFLVLSALGITNMWFAIFADVGVALLTVLNSLRISKIKYN